MFSPLPPSGTDRRGGWATLLVVLLLVALSFAALQLGIGPIVRAGFAFVAGAATGAGEAADSAVVGAEGEDADGAGEGAGRKAKSNRSRTADHANGERAQLDSAAVVFREPRPASVVLPAEEARVVSWRIPYPGEVVDMMMTASLPPQSVPPQLQNPQEVIDLVQRYYPVAVEQNGMGGTVVLSLRVDATGTVRNPTISSGLYSEELNAAALEVAKRMKFTPARQFGRNIETELNFTLVFIP